MEKLTKLAKEINLKGKSINLDDSRYVKVPCSGTYKSDIKVYGLSTHCVDCEPRDC